MYTTIALTAENEEKIDVEMAANAATVIRYKAVFHEDLQKDITPVLESLYKDAEANINAYGDINTEVLSKMAYIMHMQATDGIKKANYDSYMDWISGFGPMAFIEGAAEIIALYFGQKVSTSNPKKEGAPQIEK